MGGKSGIQGLDGGGRRSLESERKRELVVRLDVRINAAFVIERICSALK